MSLSDQIALFSIVIGLIGSFMGGVFSHHFVKWLEQHSDRLRAWPWKRIRLAAKIGAVILCFALVSVVAWVLIHWGETQRHKLSAVALSLAWSPDGRSFAAAGREPFVRIWDAVTGAELRRLRGTTFPIHETEPIRYLSFSSDGKRLAAGGIHRVWVWDIESGAEWWTSSSETTKYIPRPRETAGETVADLLGEDPGLGQTDDMLTGLAFLPTNELLIQWASSGLALFDLDKGSQTGVFERSDGVKDALAVSADGGHALTSGLTDQDFELWDLTERKRLSQSGTERPGPLDPSFDVSDLLRQSLSEHVTSIALSHNVRTLLTSSHFNAGADESAPQINDILVWDVATWKEVRRFHGHERLITSLSVSASDRVLSGSNDGTIGLWDFDSGELIRRFYGHLDGLWPRSPEITAVAISPDGLAAISAGTDGTVRAWLLPR